LMLIAVTLYQKTEKALRFQLLKIRQRLELPALKIKPEFLLDGGPAIDNLTAAPICEKRNSSRLKTTVQLISHCHLLWKKKTRNHSN